MMLAHQQQLVAWEQDRHRILVLEQKLAKAEGENSFQKKIVSAMKGFFWCKYCQTSVFVCSGMCC